MFGLVGLKTVDVNTDGGTRTACSTQTEDNTGAILKDDANSLERLTQRADLIISQDSQDTLSQKYQIMVTSLLEFLYNLVFRFP